MATTTEITNISSMLDLSGIYGDSAADYDTDAVRNAYADAIEAAARQAMAEHQEGVTDLRVLYNGAVVCNIAEAPLVRELDWKAISEGVDIVPILAAHEC